MGEEGVARKTECITSLQSGYPLMRREDRGIAGTLMVWAFAPAVCLAALFVVLAVWVWDGALTRSMTLVLILLAAVALAAAVTSALVFVRYVSGLREEVRGLLLSAASPRSHLAAVRTLLGADADRTLRKRDEDRQTMGQARMRLKKLEHEITAVSDLVTQLGELDFRSTSAEHKHEILKPIAESAARSMTLLKDFAVENARILAAAREKLSAYSGGIQTLLDGCSQAAAEVSKLQADMKEAFSETDSPEAPEELRLSADWKGELQQLSSRVEEGTQMFKVGLSLEAAKTGRASVEALTKQAEEFSFIVRRWKSLEQRMLGQMECPGGSNNGQDTVSEEQLAKLVNAVETAGNVLEKSREAIETVSGQVAETERVLAALERRLSGWTEE